MRKDQEKEKRRETTLAGKTIGRLFLSHRKDLLWNEADHLLYNKIIM